jgi:hypothetical protein
MKYNLITLRRKSFFYRTKDKSLFFQISILLVISIELIISLQFAFADGEENLRINVHIYSNALDKGIIEINDADNDYYEEKPYNIDLGRTSTTVQFAPPSNKISIGESIHVAPYSTVDNLCAFANGENHPGNTPEDISIQLEPCNR